MLEWLASDSEFNESGFNTQIYYRPYSDETCMVRLKQTKEPSLGERLEKSLQEAIEPERVIRRFTEGRD